MPAVLQIAPRTATSSPAAQALGAYLVTQIDRIVDGDLGLRHGQDPIHHTRVAIRRLRSTLRVFAPLLDAAAISGMDEELKWFAGLLGNVRDPQVQMRRFRAAVDSLPGELVLGPVRARIRDDLRAVERLARARVAQALGSPRYQAILTTLHQWREEPPVAPDASRKRLHKRAAKAAAKADRRLSSALRGSDDVPLHRARKAAKRARYAGELTKPFEDSKSTRRKIKRYKKIQTVLGEHQDTVVATAVLRQMAAAAGTTAAENGFTFGLLYAREQHLARRYRAAAHEFR
jgi:CHAD domain-containing protein